MPSIINIGFHITLMLLSVDATNMRGLYFTRIPRSQQPAIFGTFNGTAIIKEWPHCFPRSQCLVQLWANLPYAGQGLRGRHE